MVEHDLVPAGIPNMFLLDVMKRHLGDRVGHIDFSPVLPFTGENAARHETMVQRILAEEGLVAGFAWIATFRSLVGVSMILFDVDDPEQAEAARRAVNRMCDEAERWGWSEYRAHPSLVDRVAAGYGFNDGALPRLYRRLKDALDPAGILSPGNHGIRPGAGQG
ncbi:FAD-linked oxidase C-terminal domain-containing protein [Streptomyces sp. NPDC088812]|uniref:FAD-linked oxidase C-terminal domain-containing protein n=1 Tax=Streptomyces sp. NPDC088812 TaxID=3365905 RepID=UPI00382F5CC4